MKCNARIVTEKIKGESESDSFEVVSILSFSGFHTHDPNFTKSTSKPQFEFADPLGLTRSEKFNSRIS